MLSCADMGYLIFNGAVSVFFNPWGGHCRAIFSKAVTDQWIAILTILFDCCMYVCLVMQCGWEGEGEVWEKGRRG